MIVLAEFDTNYGRTSGTVVKMNTKTLWVYFQNFKEFEKKKKIKKSIIPKYNIIKRHAIKHNVKIKVEV